MNRQKINNKINEIIELIPIPNNSTKAERDKLRLALKLKEWEERLEKYLDSEEFIAPNKNTNSKIAIGDNNIQID